MLVPILLFVAQTRLQKFRRDGNLAVFKVSRAQLSPRAELQAYIKSPLELTDDVVGWWGVCFGF